LSNMSVIDHIATLPIVRPLLGLDKENIIGFAKRIGTYETSKGSELCDLLGPKHPATHSSSEEILAEESKLDVAALVRNAMSKAATEMLPGSVPAAIPVGASGTRVA
jgi:tRNA uracil 4-sulfurtransferase